MTQEDCVKNGMDLLDRKMPGWENSIDLDALSIQNVQKCVCGQLFSSYAEGLQELGVRASAWRHGFVGGQGVTEAWKREILARRMRQIDVVLDGAKSEDLALAV